MKHGPLYIQFSEKIKKLIISGTYPIGSHLPSIRKLESEYKISKNTIVASLKYLTESGYIERGESARLGYRIVKEPEGYEANLDQQQIVHFILPYSYWHHTGSHFLEQIETIFSQNQIHLMINNHKNSIEEEQRILSNISSQNSNLAQAIILMSGDHFKRPHLDLLRNINSRIPVILLDRYLLGLKAHYIGVNNWYVGYEGTLHLLEKGHRHIGFASWFSRISTIEDRLNGYCMALEHANIPFDPKIIFNKQGDVEKGGIEIQMSLEQMARLIGEKVMNLPQIPTAFVCGSDKIAHHLINFFLEKGLRIPEDMAIVGCDNDLYFAATSPIKLTTFEYPFKALAEETYWLFDALRKNSEIPHRYLELDAEFIEGKSS